MGNLCSKSANKDDNFSTPGRSLGSSSQNQPTTAPVPQKIPSSTPGRAVGGSQRPGSSSDPKSAAAAAAEVSLSLNGLFPLSDLSMSATEVRLK